jgi:Ser/Thr protein kinase RdoA (MazF antagonist)
MIKIFRSLPDAQALKALVESEYGLIFDDFTLYRDIGGAVYFSNTPTQKYVFKLSIAPYSEKAMKAARIIKFLKQNDFSVVSIVPAKSEELFINVEMPEGNRIGTLFEFIEGSTANHNDIYEIGRLTGKLHGLLSRYNDDVPKSFNKSALVGLLPVMLRNISQDNEKTDHLEAYGQALWNKVKDEPLGIIHGDWDMGNIIKQGTAFQVIDFDNVSIAPLAYDAASICNRIDYMKVNESDIEATRKAIEEFNKGYQKERDFGFEVEKILDFIAVKRYEAQGQAMNHLMPVEGNHRAHLFVEATYQWFDDWKHIFT